MSKIGSCRDLCFLNLVHPAQLELVGTQSGFWIWGFLIVKKPLEVVSIFRGLFPYFV